MVQRFGRNEQNRLEAFDVDMEKDGPCKMGRQNKKCCYARKIGRRKNNAVTDKEKERNLAGSLAKKELPAEGCSRTGVFNLLSSRANLHLSYNLAGRSHCISQNHHGYIKHHHRGMGGSPGDVGEVSTSKLILQPFRCFTYVIDTSLTS